MVQQKRAPVKKTNICELKLVPEGARSNFCCSFFCVFALHEALVKKVDLRALQSSIRRQLRWVGESGCRKRRAKEFSVLAPRAKAADLVNNALLLGTYNGPWLSLHLRVRGHPRWRQTRKHLSGRINGVVGTSTM